MSDNSIASDSIADDTITELNSGSKGQYWITTASGTRHYLNLDNWTITRYPAKGHEWSNTMLTPDGTPFQFVTMNYCKVGERSYMTAVGGEWRITSEIQSIERAEGDKDA